MNLEHQVCSPDLAKRLKELGVKQESHLKWNEPFITQTAIQQYAHAELEPRLFTEEQWDSYAEDYEPPMSRMFSAFTVAELGALFGGQNFAVGIDPHEYWCEWYAPQGPMKQSDNQSLANAAAKMLINLLENKFISEPYSVTLDTPPYKA